MRGGGAVGGPAWRRIGLGVLAAQIPAGLVDQVLAETGSVQRRVRRLPARVVVWFVLGLALFGGQGYRGVWRELTHSGGGGGPAPSTPALSQARHRLGPAALAQLFARLRGPKATLGAPGAFLCGLRLVSWDATMLDVPDSDANTAAFGRPRNGKTAGAFPQVSLLSLIECGTHAVIDAVFGAASEQALARQLLPALGPGMLLLGDRNFPSYQLWQAAAGTGAHLLWRGEGTNPPPPAPAAGRRAWARGAGRPAP